MEMPKNLKKYENNDINNLSSDIGNENNDKKIKNRGKYKVLRSTLLLLYN